MTGYHDYVLGLIPTFVLGPIAAASLVGLSVQVAVAVGGAAAALVVGHAMFVRGPAPTTTATVTAADGVDSTAADQPTPAPQQNNTAVAPGGD